MTKKMNVKKELRRLVRDAVSPIGGSGGRRQCQYCLRESFKGQPEHWRVDVKSKSEGCNTEANEHCAVIVMREALKAL